MNLTLYTDGGSRGNPGPGAAGVVLLDAADGTPIHEAGYLLGHCTNNEAEWRALIHGLDVLLTLKPRKVRIISDSQNMVRQVAGEWKVKAPNLKPLHEQAMHRLKALASYQIEHARRHKNVRADELVNLAMDTGQTVIVTDAADFRER